MIPLRFICGERKICSTIKKSQKIMKMIVGLETLEKRKWYRKLCCFDKVYKSHFSEIPFSLLRSLSGMNWN